MAKNSQLVVLGVIGMVVVAVGIMLAGGLGPFASTEGSGANTAATQSGQAAQFQCESSTTPDFDINAIDGRNVGTADTEGTNLWRKKGTNSWAAFTAGTAVTGSVSVGDTIEYVMGISTSDVTDNSYGKVGELEITCDENIALEVPVYIDEVETSLTASYYNADDAAATAEVFVAGQTQTVASKFVTASDEFFGNPNIVLDGGENPDGRNQKYPNTACAELNFSAWDAPEKVFVLEGAVIELADGSSVEYKAGEELKRVGTPDIHSQNNAATTDTSYCYEYPLVADIGPKVGFSLNADDTNAPAVDDALFLYAGNYYVDSDDGIVKWGVETEDDAFVGTDAADSLALDFT